MKDNVKKLAELKIKLVTATNFHEVFTFFFDHFGENNAFLKVGTSKHNETLQEILVRSARPILKEKDVIVLKDLRMIYIAEQKFYHGAAFINDMMMNFFYFEEVDTGLMALARLKPGSQTMIGRFSLQAINKPSEPSPN